MKLNISLFGLIALFCLAFAANLSAAFAQNDFIKGSGEIVISTSGGTMEAAQKAAYYEPFTKGTGIRVVLHPGSDKVLVSLERGDAPEVDIVQLSGDTAALYERKHALEKLDYQYFDAETLAGVPQKDRQEFTVGQSTLAMGIAYNEEAVKSGSVPKNWAEFFDAKEFPGARAIPACNAGYLVFGAVLETALMGDGVPADKLYPLDIDRAFRKLDAVRPNVNVFYASTGEGAQSLIDGRADFAATFNGRIYAVRKDGAKVNFQWGQSLVQVGYWGVIKNSPNRENAMKFLAFASRAQQQAALSNLMAYGPTNEKAFAYIKPELKKWLPGSPENLPNQVQLNYEWWNETGQDGKSNYERALDRCNRFMVR
ncbi:hypothetical protein BST63_02775 [Bradyrhizobium canariense]|uniref:Spermidine/putrescine transport system substrate-binding protein n=1 Tax=Bradyrhizobium canariense TaxID=255045 RepID=A0ABX3XAI7_9BRAD|nr:ABC transporter substrate-binding protein [Bradyrhizobium canariense]OSJ19443.1 hypothetical protein BSR47_02940 [Bradyrhizobium canariense]OSJ34897.1 hypothetical protein BST63_02775 [Bradyrhizobium canariense]